MKWNGRVRCTLVCCGFAVLFSVFSFRLVYLQMVRHDYYTALATKKDTSQIPIYAERGTILDTNNEPLSQNVPVENVILDAPLVNDRAKLVPLLAGTLRISPREIEAKIDEGRLYYRLKLAFPEEEAISLGKKLSAAKLRGIQFERDFVRRYPNGSMLCHVIGFTDYDHKGIQGVEKSMEDYLHGEDGYREIEHDRTGKELVLYRGAEHPPRDGNNVHLTIDLNLQNIVEDELNAAVRKYTPKKATIILMRPQTGEILAMANRPNFDLNQRSTAKDEQKINCAIAAQMEPGSTFKIVTVGSALNEHKVQLDTPIFCENGPWRYGGSFLHDHKYYGEIPVQDVLVKSSNIGAAKIALMLGDMKFYQYICNFGFGRQTGIELPGEIAGHIESPRGWSKISITRMPMGHEVAVTPLQMIVAMATIANGGKMVAPHIIESIVDAKGNIVSEPKPAVVRQVISREAAEQVTLALRGVVSARGTAVEAAVPGFAVSGKTGTASKNNPKGGYFKGVEIVSFCGFLPSENPAFVALVVLDDAHTATAEENYGGKVAAPIFAHVAEKAARYLDLEPHEEVGKQVALTEARR